MEENIPPKQIIHQSASFSRDQNIKRANNLITTGDHLKNWNCFDAAIECYEKSLKTLNYKHSDFRRLTPEQLKQDQVKYRSIADVKNKIGCCLNHLLRYEKAKDNFESSLQI